MQQAYALQGTFSNAILEAYIPVWVSAILFAVRIDDEIHEQFLTKFKDLKVHITYYCAQVLIIPFTPITLDWCFRC